MERDRFEILRASGILVALGAAAAACSGGTVEPTRAPETAEQWSLNFLDGFTKHQTKSVLGIARCVR